MGFATVLLGRSSWPKVLDCRAGGRVRSGCQTADEGAEKIVAAWFMLTCAWHWT